MQSFWAKGNVHTHTNESDGNASPQAVADWYRTRGYDFLIITDHNKLTNPAEFVSPVDGFLLVPGEELSTSADHVHVNALGVEGQLDPVPSTTKLEALQKNIDLIVDAGGLAMMNHPNWHYALDVPELARAQRCSLMEIYNASSECNNEGDATHPSVEKMWDELLTHGIQMYAVADDDAHNYTRSTPDPDNPGLAWIVARVNKLTRQDVLGAIANGDFYSSTGVELRDIRFRGGTLSISVKPEKAKTYTIQFIGPGGKVADEKTGTKASCKIGDAADAYIRAKIIANDGTFAWTQAFRRAK